MPELLQWANSGLCSVEQPEAVEVSSGTILRICLGAAFWNSRLLQELQPTLLLLHIAAGPVLVTVAVTIPLFQNASQTLLSRRRDSRQAIKMQTSGEKASQTSETVCSTRWCCGCLSRLNWKNNGFAMHRAEALLGGDAKGRCRCVVDVKRVATSDRWVDACVKLSLLGCSQAAGGQF